MATAPEDLRTSLDEAWRTRVRDLIRRYNELPAGEQRAALRTRIMDNFRRQLEGGVSLQALQGFAAQHNFAAAERLESPAGEEPEPPEEPEPGQTTALQLIKDTLAIYGIVDNAISNRAWDLIKQGFTDVQFIISQLRAMPEYQAYFPELSMRAEAGLPFMNEGTILGYRQQAKEFARTYFGRDLSNEQISQAIGNDISLSELEHKFQVRKRVMDYGDSVTAYFSTQLGIELDDQSLQDLFDSEVDTSEWDQAYESALYSAVPAVLFGNRTLPENLIPELKAMGIAPDQAFGNYQKMAQEMPAYQRVLAINDALRGTAETMPTGNDFFNGRPWEDLLRVFQFGDMEVFESMRREFAQETARHTVRGGVAGGGKGLLSKEERNRAGS